MINLFITDIFPKIISITSIKYFLEILFILISHSLDKHSCLILPNIIQVYPPCFILPYSISYYYVYERISRYPLYFLVIRLKY